MEKTGGKNPERDKSRDGLRDMKQDKMELRESRKRKSGFSDAPLEFTIPLEATEGQGFGTPAFTKIFPKPYGKFGADPMLPVIAITQKTTRHARRVLVTGLPQSVIDTSVVDFFNQVMVTVGGNAAGPGNSVVDVFMNERESSAFVEFRTVEEASNALAVKGILFEGHPVDVSRPSDYDPTSAARLGPSQPSLSLNLAAVGLSPESAACFRGSEPLFVGGLPIDFAEADVRQLLEIFGRLKEFCVVKDRETGLSKGYGSCIYFDQSDAEIACVALSGINIGYKTLIVRPADPKPGQESIHLQPQQHLVLQQKRLLLEGFIPSKVVCLTQAVSADDLIDDNDYEEIMQDMRSQAEKYGTLVDVFIPRPKPNGIPTPGIGKVFLEFADSDAAAKARLAMHGRKFANNEVVAVFFPLKKFLQGSYDG